jgi:putative heme iron utilization protein
MTQSATLKVFETLRRGFEEKQSTLIAEAIAEALESNNADLDKTLATKADIIRLDSKISETKTEIIKWTFLFIIGQTGVILAILKLIVVK